MDYNRNRHYGGIPPICAYPEGLEDIPHRPKLSKEFARFVYNPGICHEMHNSIVWTIEYRINSLLPTLDSLAYLSRQCACLLKMKNGNAEPCPDQKPEILCDFITELLQNNSRADLKARWGKENYSKIMEDIRYLFYRVNCRRRIMSLYYGSSPGSLHGLQKEKRKVRKDEVLDQDAVKSLSSILLPAHVMEKSSGSPLQGPQ